MATRENEQYYYFKMWLGSPYEIKVTAVHINTVINLIYREMTNEQKEFYLEHPTASVMEVWNCQLIPPYVPPTPNVQEYASMRVKELKDACYASVKITDLEYAMAEDKVNNVLADSYYSLTEANAILALFRTQSKKAMQVYDTYKSRIEAAVSVESVDLIYDEAVNSL